ncbi:MAG: hypoxanthine phosphoribosyltransferase [Deltaproteobacteria bacterium]|nr:hypoxanthine phosphoribosyltransferase [Deltaproteobacteria bacterium]
MTGNLKLIIPPDEILEIVTGLAAEIEKDCAVGTPVLLGVLKGAFVFLSDLARAFSRHVEIDFIQASSYGDRDTPSRDVLITGGPSIDIKGRDVIIVEGIVDRGVTAKAVTGYLKSKGPASLKTCALLLRHSHRGVNIDYIGRRIDEGFVVGYGMDYKGRYRNLPGIYIIK